MANQRNPFIVGGPVPPERFIGREREVKDILDRLASPAHGSTAVSGKQGIGKTSLLHCIASPEVAKKWGLSPEKCAFVFMDPRTIVPFTPDSFWRYILKSLVARQICDPRRIESLLRRRKEINPFELGEFFDYIAQEGKIVVLLLEGFDYIVEHVRPDSPDILYLLRALINRPMRGLALVLASHEPLYALLDHFRFAGSHFAASFTLLSLDPFSLEEANELIDVYTHSTGVTFSDRDREFAYEEISKGHPYLLQKVCFKLFQRHCEQSSLLDDSDYEAITAEMVAPKEPAAISIFRRRRKKPVVLHLSDLQFGPHHAFKNRQKALDKLKEDIDRYEQEGIPRPNIVVVSGDLADTGGVKDDEYEAVTLFLEGLCQHLSIDRRYVVLAPGNHDVNWDKARELEDLKKRRDSKGLTAVIKAFFSQWQKSGPVGAYAGVNYLDRFVKYTEFYNRFYRKGGGATHYTCDLSCEEGFNIIYDFHSEWGIAFLALNSCEKEDHHNENHYGYISPSVLKSALEEVEEMIATPCVKVAVFHHNALAGGGEDRLRNFHSEILPALSQAGFSLALHGHTHKPDVDDLGPELIGGTRVRVVGAGSVCVARAQRPGSDREGQVPNQYWILAFELGEYRGQFTAYARQYDPNLAGKHTQGKWIPYNLFTVAGKSTDRRTFDIDAI